MSQLQDWPDPMVRLRATPLIADLKDLDLHPHLATRVAARHTLSALSLPWERAQRMAHRR